MLRNKGLALALVLGGGLALGSSAALADDNSASARKDRVEDHASATKDRIDDNAKEQKKAIEERADREKDTVEKRADREKDAVDKNVRAEKAAIDHEGTGTREASNDKGGAKEEVSDAWITTKIKSRFVGDKALKGSDISVDTDHTGEVTLTGTAPSKKASQRAFQVASTTKGVRSVNNQVVISPAK